MQKVYAPKQFFREISSELLLEYLAQKKHPFPAGNKDPLSEELYEFWSSIESNEDRNSMEEDFLDVHGFLQLPNAIASIFQEANFRKEHSDLFADFEAHAETFFAKLKTLTFPQDRAFWVLMHYESIFVNAFRFSSADKSSGRRYSTKRPTGCFGKPKDDDRAKMDLGKSISDFFRSKGKGEGHKVDILDRDGVIYYFIYLEDSPKSGGIFKKGVYKKELLRTSFEIVFWFDPKSGELSTCARGGRDSKEQLERRFAEICLGNPDLPPLPKMPVYNLELFKDPKFLLDTNEADGFLSARVKALKLLPPDSGYEMVLNATVQTEDVRRHLMRLYLGTDGGNIPLSEFKVASAKIEIIKTKNSSHSEKLEFGLYYPNGCDLGDSLDDRSARACLVRMGIQNGGSPEIVRQLMAVYEQGEPIGHLQVGEWPEEALAGFLEQKILKQSISLQAIPCSGCEQQPLCEVQYRQENGIQIAYIACPQCGMSILREEELRQYRVDPDGMVAFIVKELQLKSGTINKQDRLWDLGPYTNSDGGGRVFLLHGPANAGAEKIKMALENEVGICFGLCLPFEKPSWLPNGLSFFSLRREILINGKSISLDIQHIMEAYGRFLEKRKPELKDKFGNSRPANLNLPGNVAERDRELIKTWKKYLGIYSPEVQVYLFEKETAVLDWQQAQRARFIFPGNKPEGQYNRHLQKLRLGPLSNMPEPDVGWFQKPYKRRKKALSNE